MLTSDMLKIIVEAIKRICTNPGFGEVAIIIEKGRPRRIRITEEPWLEERSGGQWGPTTTQAG